MEHLREQTYTSTTNTQAFAYDKQNELLNKEESPQNINQQYKIQLFPSKPASFPHNFAEMYPSAKEQEKPLNQYSYSSFSSIEDDLYLLKQQREDQHYHSKPKKKSNRKLRTMITQQKLILMNVLFQNYKENTEHGYNQEGTGKRMLKQLISKGIKVNQNEIAQISSLQKASHILNLAYSTVLHKYKEFRQNREVKGGPRMNSKYEKLKYKKTLEIEEIITECLTARPFYTAIELSKYIVDKYNVFFSRSKINRHLATMGFSLSMVPSYLKKVNNPEVKFIRRSFVQTIEKHMTSHKHTNLIYLDEFLFSNNKVSPDRRAQNLSKIIDKTSPQFQQNNVSLFIAINQEKVIDYQIKKGMYSKLHFMEELRNLKYLLEQQNKKKTIENRVLIFDMHPIHIDDPPTPNHQRENIDQLILSLKMKRIYLPPYSPQLNPCLSLFSDVQLELNSLKSKKENLFVRLQKVMKSFEANPTKPYFQKLQIYHQKSLQMQQF